MYDFVFASLAAGLLGGAPATTAATCASERPGLGLIEPTSCPAVPPRCSAPPGIDLSGIQALFTGKYAGLRSFVRVTWKGCLIYECAFNGSTTTSSTAVEWASNTKWVSGALFAQLDDAGVLDLSTPLTTVLTEPAWQKEYYPLAKYSQFLSHTSGINRRGSDCLNRCDATTTLRTCAEAIRNQTPAFTSAPDEFFEYTGVGYQVAAYAAERAAKQRLSSSATYASLMQSRVLTPLGMNSTRFDCTTNPRAAGGLRGSPRDYTRFMEMFLPMFSGRAGLVFKNDTAGAVRTVLRNHAAGIPVKSAPPNTFGHPELNNGYGLGLFWQRVDTTGQCLLEAAHGGTLGTNAWLDFERNVAGFFLVEGTSQPGADLDPYIDLMGVVRAAIPIE